VADRHTGFGLANFLFTFPAFRFVDSRGRRPLLLVSFSGMLFSLAAVTGFFKLTDPETRLILVSIISIAFFVLFYSIGAGPIPFTLSAEVFPLHVRGKSSDLANPHHIRLGV
jgi:MFS family permease